MDENNQPVKELDPNSSSTDQLTVTNSVDSPFAANLNTEQGSLQSVTTPPNGSEGSITWTASEFIYHEKDVRWYLIAVAITAVIASILWLFLDNVISAVVIILVGVLLIYTAGKKPREAEYKIAGNSIFVNQKEYKFDQFSSFAKIKQGAFSGLVFSPLKRFALYLTVYYDPADEARIIELLDGRLPLEDFHRDWIEDLLWKIKY